MKKLQAGEAKSPSKTKAACDSGRNYQCPICGVGVLFDPFGSDWKPDCGDIDVRVEKISDGFRVQLGDQRIDCSRFSANRLAAALKTMLSERVA